GGAVAARPSSRRKIDVRIPAQLCNPCGEPDEPPDIRRTGVRSRPTESIARGIDGSLDDDLIEQVPKCCQAFAGKYNTGAHHGAGLVHPSKHQGGILAYVRKGQRCKIASGRYVELSVAENFRDTVRVYYRRRLL